jgi:hypothetical protein
MNAKMNFAKNPLLKAQMGNPNINPRNPNKNQGKQNKK